MQLMNLSAGRFAPQVRFLTSCAVYNRYKKEPYKTIDELLYPAAETPYRIYPEKALYKLLFRSKKKNPLFFRPPVGRPSIDIETATASVHTARTCSSKRVKILNKLFMRYIPEILSTSALGIHLFDYDIQFSEVKVGPNYDIVKVYWIPRGTEQDEVIQGLLNQVAYPLRRELINLRLMGLVPPINFVKDKRHAFLLEVDRRLRIADYGEDYVPSFLNENTLKKDLRLEIQLPHGLRERIISIDENVEFTDQEEREIPPMPLNTLGLNYGKILNSILDGKRRAKIQNQTIESLIGKSAVKEVPFSCEAQPASRWDKKAYFQYLRDQSNKRKLAMKMKKREYSDQLREAAQRIYPENEEVDEIREENELDDPLPDVIEELEDECSM